MPYQLISTDEQDDIIVGFLWLQEKDVYCHQANLERFNSMLLTLPEGKYKDYITQLRDDTQARVNEVKAIIGATVAQLPPQVRIDAAMARVRARETAGEIGKR